MTDFISVILFLLFHGFVFLSKPTKYGMENNHLTYFKIENFKRFDSFEMENLGQFNLLVGDNNVGKTSVLEGLCFDIDGHTFLLNLFQTLIFRKIIFADNEGYLANFKDDNFWKLFFKDIEKTIFLTFESSFEGASNNLGKINLKIVTDKDLTEEDRISLLKESPLVRKQLFPLEKALRIGTNFTSPVFISFLRNHDTTIFGSANLSFIPNNLGYNNDLLDFYYKQINTDKAQRKEFEESLKTFIPKLEEVRSQKFFNNVDFLGVVLEDENGIYPLTRFGDGTVKLVRILLEIFMAKGNRLMIDEIDTGIHFSRLKEFWKTVLQLCKKYNVQLFATTHSLECQKCFVEALSELPDFQSDARNITLIEDPNHEVKSVTFDYEQFKYAMQVGFNTRGGVV